MASTGNSGNGHGTNGVPQTDIEETEYPSKVDENEKTETQPTYVPSPKHEPCHGWGSGNPIKSSEEGQMLLLTGYPFGKQIYNVTDEGKIVKFQPDGSPENGYHAYEVSKPRDIPASVLKQLLKDGKISKSDYNKYRKGKK